MQDAFGQRRHNVIRESTPIEGAWPKAGNLAVLAVYRTGRAQTVPIGVPGHHACLVTHMLVLPQFEGQLLVEWIRRCICTPKAQIRKSMAGMDLCTNLWRSQGAGTLWEFISVPEEQYRNVSVDPPQ